MSRIEPGTYIAIAKEWSLTESKNGTPGITVAFELDDGRPVNWTGWLTDKTLSRTVESLRYCGWQGSDITDPALYGMGNRKVELVIDDELGQDGKKYYRVKWVNKLGGGGLKVSSKPEGQKLRQLAAEVKALAASIPALPPTDRVPGSDDPF